LQHPPVEYGAGSGNDTFWQADLHEARGRHRLLKSKRGSRNTDPVYFALKRNATHAQAEAREWGLRELPWNSDARNLPVGGVGNWEWREATAEDEEDR
jgi:hypothetical protein